MNIITNNTVSKVLTSLLMTIIMSVPLSVNAEEKPKDDQPLVCKINPFCEKDGQADKTED